MVITLSTSIKFCTNIEATYTQIIESQILTINVCISYIKCISEKIANILTWSVKTSFKPHIKAYDIRLVKTLKVYRSRCYTGQPKRNIFFDKERKI